MPPQLPQPIVNADSAPYWAGARAGKLLIRKCKDCGTLHFMPRYLCPACWSNNLEWVQAAGRGTVHSFTEIRRASDPAFADKVPYVVALIDLEEGTRIVSNLCEIEADDVTIGLPVEAFIRKFDNGVALPLFRPRRIA